MSEKRKKNPVMVTESGCFIDPLSCGSTILYRIYDSDNYSHSEFSGSISLSDCSRSIQWEFGTDKESFEKIDRAISALKGFRKGLVIAKKLQKRKSKILKRKDAEEKAKKNKKKP